MMNDEEFAQEVLRRAQVRQRLLRRRTRFRLAGGAACAACLLLGALLTPELNALSVANPGAASVFADGPLAHVICGLALALLLGCGLWLLERHLFKL